MEGQYLPAIDPTPLFTQLNYAIVLHIKHPIRIKLFLSHSIRDIKLVKEIESQLLLLIYYIGLLSVNQKKVCQMRNEYNSYRIYTYENVAILKSLQLLSNRFN